MGSFDWFGGIDFSGAREPLANLWTAIGREEDGKLLIVSLRPHAFRRDLCGYVADGWRSGVAAGPAERILWGADFPFGIPAAAAAHLGVGQEGGASWARLLAWAADRPPEEVREAVPEELRGLRVTDQGGAPSPFDLRTYKQAVEGMRWLHELRELSDLSVHPQLPATDSATGLVEVNPASTAQELGLPRRRAPSRPGESRARAAALRTFLRFAGTDAEAAAVALEDAWDAVLACLGAWLARDDLQQPFRSSDAPREQIELEGWIYRPPAALP